VCPTPGSSIDLTSLPSWHNAATILCDSSGGTTRPAAPTNIQAGTPRNHAVHAGSPLPEIGTIATNCSARA
jgi:hypothetical protein